MAVSYSPLRPDSQRVEAVLMIGRNLTEHMQASEALQQAQAELAHVTRVTTLGEMAASIAHEVNQPLAAIVTNGEICLRLLGRDVPDLDELRAAVHGMISDGRRASEVIRRLRALAKKTDITPRVWLNLNDVVDEVIPLVQREVLNYRITLRFDLAPALPPVLGDRVQLQQVIINLLINGVQAMASVDDRPRELLISSQRHETDQVLVAVRDSGIGIDPEIANRLFDAFFTTKPKGMGMGLSICRSIIEAHGGEMWASPNDGPGATFLFTVQSQQEAAT
jgi:C4-dicarboxylate-specific signal transduction histidine kinase